MTTRRTLLLGAAGLLAGAAGPALPHPPLRRRVPLAAEPIDRLSTAWWRRRHEAKLAEIRTGRHDLVWLGDSITQQWEYVGPPVWRDFQPIWRKFYGDRHALNLGFIGDATSHLLWRMMHGELEGLSPKAAVILIGANNLGRVHWPAEDNVLGIEAVVNEARRRLPRTQLLLLGILPSDRGPWVAETGQAVNRALHATYAASRVANVTYMDVGPLLLRDGRLARTLFVDPRLRPPAPALHPSPAGMARIAAAIEPTLARLMGDRDHTL